MRIDEAMECLTELVAGRESEWAALEAVMRELESQQADRRGLTVTVTNLARQAARMRVALGSISRLGQTTGMSLENQAMQACDLAVDALRPVGAPGWETRLDERLRACRLAREAAKPPGGPAALLELAEKLRQRLSERAREDGAKGGTP